MLRRPACPARCRGCVSIGDHASSVRPRQSALGVRALMARRSLLFRQGDVVRAIKAVKKAGQRVSRVEITRDGTITVISSQKDDEITAPIEHNPWNEANS